MNSIIKTLALGALIGSATALKADTTVYVDPSKTWNGYMNVFALPADGGGFIFGSTWGTADLRAVFSGSVLTLSPNTIGDPNPFWYIGGGAPGHPGNKTMDASMYVQVDNGSLTDTTVTFTGTVTANTLTTAHTTVAFIKDFAPDYSSYNEETVPLTNGVFNISLLTDPGAGRHVQYGFETIGVNVWATDVAPFGSAKISTIPIVPGNPIVKVDPAAAWQGYVNVFELPSAGGAFVEGYAQPVTTDLRAAFTSSGLVLSPFTIDPVPNGLSDPYWYQGNGSGNKRIDANLYVQPKDGTLSGQTVNFSGSVSAKSLTSAHTTIAFIKEYTADYSSSAVSSAVLTPGAFSINLLISGDPTKHVQYGFQTVGPNVFPTNAAAAGSVQVASVITNSFATWMARFDFSSFISPNLTATGDPDGDGQSNFAEFALDGNPASAAVSGRTQVAVGNVSGNNALLYTLPVFNGATFAGSPAPSATMGDLTYTIQGSNGLALFDQAVTEVSPAVTAGLPVIDAGWTYRSFRLNGAVGGATPRGPAGFLRARIVKTP